VVPSGFKVPGTSYQFDSLKGVLDFWAMIPYVNHNDGFVDADEFTVPVCIMDVFSTTTGPKGLVQLTLLVRPSIARPRVSRRAR
jgi:hypothetical protein